MVGFGARVCVIPTTYFDPPRSGSDPLQTEASEEAMKNFVTIDWNRHPAPATDVAERLLEDRWFDRPVDPRFGACDLNWCPGFRPYPRTAYRTMTRVKS